MAGQDLNNPQSEVRNPQSGFPSPQSERLDFLRRKFSRASHPSNCWLGRSSKASSPGCIDLPSPASRLNLPNIGNIFQGTICATSIGKFSDAQIGITSKNIGLI